MPPAVLDAFEDATDLLEANTPDQSAALLGDAREFWISRALTLDRYNNGILGPGHCSDGGAS